MSGPYWVNELNNELNQMYPSAESITKWKKRCIYKLPAYVTDLNERAFMPRVVSIGPYHHGREDLKAMEEHKHRALLYFIERSKKPLESYVDALIPVEQDLQDAYDGLALKWQQDTDAFLKMMILDGCFLLEIMLATTSLSWSSDSPILEERPRLMDPTFSDHGRLYFVSHLKRDMLMLENQIPMLVLQILLGVALSMPVNSGEQSDEIKDSVAKLIINFFSIPLKNTMKFHQCLHFLDVYRESLLLEKPRQRKSKHKRFPSTSTHRITRDGIIRSATELKEAGIRFKRSKSRSLRDISFHNGILELPLIVVDDVLKSLYLNMIAFERLHVRAGNEVTSYIFFMDTLINIPTDVSLLESRGIIQNTLGGENAAVNLFNSLSTGIVLDRGSDLDMVHKQISEYCQRRQRGRKWQAYLTHNYYNFTNPRDALSFQIGIYLFCFTIIQTVFTVLSYTSSSPRK